MCAILYSMYVCIVCIVCMYVCMHACMYMCMYIHTPIPTYIQHINICTYTQTHTNPHKYIQESAALKRVAAISQQSGQSNMYLRRASALALSNESPQNAVNRCVCVYVCMYVCMYVCVCEF